MTDERERERERESGLYFDVEPLTKKPIDTQANLVFCFLLNSEKTLPSES